MTAGGVAAAPASRARHRVPTAAGGSLPAAVGSGLLTGVLVVAVLAAIVLAVVPRVLGGAALTVLSGSMEPLYSAGDVVVVVPVEGAEIQVGDVVAFQPVSDDPMLITHRVVAKSLGGEGAARLVTRGDANGADDDPIVPEQVMGRVLYHVPAVGHVAIWVGDSAGVLVMLTAAALLTYAAVQFAQLARPRTRRAPS